MGRVQVSMEECVGGGKVEISALKAALAEAWPVIVKPVHLSET